MRYLYLSCLYRGNLYHAHVWPNQTVSLRPAHCDCVTEVSNMYSNKNIKDKCCQFCEYCELLCQLCPNLPNFAQLCPTLPNFAQLCPTLPNFAYICPTLPSVAERCPILTKFTKVLPSSPKFTKVPQTNNMVQTDMSHLWQLTYTLREDLKKKRKRKKCKLFPNWPQTPPLLEM